MGEEIFDVDFKDKVVYQIYPKSFQDSDGDGRGDLQGIISRLDYLSWLGVDYLWLTPFFPSPQRDNGYDVANYCAIDPRYGTMADFETLVAEARKRGIGLMLDMVFNHTSTEHIWFKRALNGDEQYQSYYFFQSGTADKIPCNWESKFGGPAWKYVPALGKWYLHLFDEGQADLNWENPAVREELKQVIRFWKAKGVAGFRFDVVNLISKPKKFEDDGQGDGRRFYTDGPHVHEFLQELVRDTGIGNMVTVGELSSTTLANGQRYAGAGTGELSMCFSFHHLKVDYKDGDKWQLMVPDIGNLRELLQEWQEGMQASDSWNAVFWCNHDQPRVVSRFGDTGRYWKESAKMLAGCIHLLRGTPYIYQGEELGMPNAGFRDIGQYRDVETLNYHKILRERGLSEEEAMKVIQARSRDNSRTPMQWQAGRNAGFTAGTPWIGLPEAAASIHVEAEQNDSDSILQFYRKLIRLRKEQKLIAEGSIAFIETENPDIIVYRRKLGQQELVVYCNFRSYSVHTAKDWRQYPATGWRLLLSNYAEENSLAELRPYELMVWLKD